MYDNYGEGNLFEGIRGKSEDYAVGYYLMGTRSIPLEKDVRNAEGVYRHGIGIGIGIYMSNSKTIRLW